MTNRSTPIWFVILLILTACHSTRKTTESNVAYKKNATKTNEYYSQKLGFIVDNSCNKELLEESISWLGVPYKYGAMSRSEVDCSGLVCLIFKKVYQKQLPRTVNEMYDHSKKIARNKLAEGDLVFFNINGKKLSHVGIYLKDDRFIHATTKKGVVINNLNDSYYKNFFFQAGRIN